MKKESAVINNHSPFIISIQKLLIVYKNPMKKILLGIKLYI